MKPILIMVTLLAIFSTVSKVQTLDTIKKENSDTTYVPEAPIYTIVEKMPEFPNGGIAGFFKYLKDSVKYPDKAKAKSIRGKVVVVFVIEKDGSTSNVHVLKSLSKETDAEAIRLIKQSPKWIPGYQQSKPQRVMCPMPIPVFFQQPN